MVREIYIRTPDDPYYESGIIDHNNEIESVISQVKVLLGTEQGDVLGTYDFGIDLEYLVFNTKRAAYSIEEELNRQISTYVYHSNNVTINTEVSFGQSELGYDIALIDLYINGKKAIGFLVDRDKNET